MSNSTRTPTPAQVTGVPGPLSPIALEPKIIQDPGEKPLVLYSDVRSPLAGLSFLRRSLALAELAMIAYNDEAEAQRAARAIGFSEAQLFDHGNVRSVGTACRALFEGHWLDHRSRSQIGMLGSGLRFRPHPVRGKGLSHLVRSN